MEGLEIEAVSHRYGAVLAVDEVTLAVAPGEVVCLLGPSGCGKTTLLRVAAGLEVLQRGRVRIAGALVADDRRCLPPEQRGVGMVFQDYALFPHLSVGENVAFGLRRLSREQRRARALEVLARVGIAELAESYPHTLSGGQQQRVALARALAPRPPVMLLDEPFAGLDRRLREQVRDDTVRVLRESGAAVLMVTHDPEEAMALGDRVAIMRAGRLEQVGSPRALYFAPVSRFVATFLGEANFLPGEVEPGGVRTELGLLPAAGLPPGQPVEVVIRPEEVRLTPDETATASIVAQQFLGPYTVQRVQLPSGLVLRAHQPSRAALPVGCRVRVGITTPEVAVIAAGERERALTGPLPRH